MQSWIWALSAAYNQSVPNFDCWSLLRTYTTTLPQQSIFPWPLHLRDIQDGGQRPYWNHGFRFSFSCFIFMLKPLWPINLLKIAVLSSNEVVMLWIDILTSGDLKLNKIVVPYIKKWFNWNIILMSHVKPSIMFRLSVKLLEKTGVGDITSCLYPCIMNENKHNMSQGLLSEALIMLQRCDTYVTPS